MVGICGCPDGFYAARHTLQSRPRAGAAPSAAPPSLRRQPPMNMHSACGCIEMATYRRQVIEIAALFCDPSSDPSMRDTPVGILNPMHMNLNLVRDTQGYETPGRVRVRDSTSQHRRNDRGAICLAKWRRFLLAATTRWMGDGWSCILAIDLRRSGLYSAPNSAHRPADCDSARRAAAARMQRPP